MFAEDNDRDNLILHRGAESFVIFNAYPYTSGHLMVLPNRHVRNIEDLTDSELLEVNQLVAKAISWIKAAYQPEGFNIGVNIGAAAGAGIPQHLHWHIVPRWAGDTNFMTAVGNVRVIPQDLRQAYDTVLKVKNGEG